jgi:hypothetical protein
MADIGYQDGITAFNDWFRKFSLWIDAFEAWSTLPNEQRNQTKPPIPPRIPRRGANYNKDDLSTWPWPDKHERTERMLKDWHDEEHADAQPPPPPPPPPGTKYAPLAYNSGTGPTNTGYGAEPSARYNTLINCTRRADGSYVDGEGVVYDDGGRQAGGRTEKFVFGLKHANSMDGKEAYEPYDDSPDGQMHPPYPSASYER